MEQRKIRILNKEKELEKKENEIAIRMHDVMQKEILLLELFNPK